MDIHPLVLSYNLPVVSPNAGSSDVMKTPHPLSPHETLTPQGFSEHPTLWQSCVHHARHKPRERNTPLAQYRLDNLDSRPEVPRLTNPQRQRP